MLDKPRRKVLVCLCKDIFRITFAGLVVGGFIQKLSSGIVLSGIITCIIAGFLALVFSPTNGD